MGVCPFKGLLMPMPWFRFYSEALDDPKVQRLTGDLFKVWVNLLCLASEQDERGTLPPPSDIAFRLRIDDQKADDALTGLRRAGLLDLDPDTDLYVIHAWAVRQPPSDADSTAAERKRRQRERDKGNKPVTRDVTRDNSVTSRTGHGRVTGDVTRLDKKRLEEDTDTEEREITPPTPTPLRPVAAPPDRPAKDPPGFAAFWQAWPKKEGKAKALTAWKSLRLADGELDDILAAIPRQYAAKDWPRENWRYCPLPASWLNQRRWEDETPDPPPETRRELVGKDRERLGVAERVLARRAHERAGTDDIAHQAGGALPRDIDGHRARRLPG